MAKIFEEIGKPYPAEMPQLISLRFFAAFLVMLRHNLHLTPIKFPTDVTGLDIKAPFLIDIFCVLSGFLLTHVYMQDIANKKFSMRDYWVRRVARVYPAYLVSLAFALGATMWVWAGQYIPGYEKPFLTPFLLLEHVFLVQGWGFIEKLYYVINPPSWSVSVEWFIYILFPFMMMGALYLRPLVFFIFSLLFFESCRYTSIYLSPEPSMYGIIDFRTPWAVVRALSAFVAGMGAYRLGCRWKLNSAFSGHTPFLGVVATIFIMAHFRAPDILIVPFIPLIIFMLAEQSRNGKGGIMTSRAFVYLGKTSYSLYLMHFPIANPLLIAAYAHFYVRGLLTPQLQYILCAGAFPVSILVAIILYELVENPCRSFIIRKFQKRKK